MAMTQQKRRFCQFIVSGFNQTQSALKAGFKESSAKAYGSQLMALDEIKDYIEALRHLDNKFEGQPPIIEDIESAKVSKNPLEVLADLMTNCDDNNIRLNAAKALAPYYFLKESEKDTTKRLGVKELKEANAKAATTGSKFATLDHQLSNIYEHEKE